MKEKHKVKIICVLITEGLAFIAGGKGVSIVINNNIETATTGEVKDVDDLVKQYESAIEEKTKLADEYESLKVENTELQGELLHTTAAELKSPVFVIDGMESEQNWNKSIAEVNNTNYYSETMLSSLLEGKLSYDKEKNTLYYNSNNEDINTITKVDAIETGVLYDGTNYEAVKKSDGKEISIGSQSYNEGFVIWDDESLFGEGAGCALFDLKGQYSKIEFDVGKTNDYEKENVDLKVYLNNDKELKATYSLDAEVPLIHCEIDLNYASNMKMELTGGTRVKYGFVNVELYY